MQLARIFGRVIATVKHSSFAGSRLMLAQPLRIDRSPDGDPFLVVDTLGAARGSLVIISSDGQSARREVGDRNSPVRWFVMGIVDNDEPNPT